MMNSLLKLPPSVIIRIVFLIQFSIMISDYRSFLFIYIFLFPIMHVYAVCPFCKQTDSESCDCEKILKRFLSEFNEVSNVCSSNDGSLGKKSQIGLAHSHSKVSVSYVSSSAGRFEVDSLLPGSSMLLNSLISHVKKCKTTVHITEQFIVMIRNMIRQNMIGIQTDSEWKISLENAIKKSSATSNTIYYWMNAGRRKDSKINAKDLWIFIVISNDQVTNTPIFSMVEWEWGRFGDQFRFFSYDNYENILLHMSLLFAGQIIDVTQTGYFLSED